SSSQEVGKPLERGHRGLQLVTGNPDKLIFAAFQFSAFADVTGKFGPANDPAGAIFDRGDTQGKLDDRPIFSQAHRLIVIDSLALAQFCKDLLLLRVKFGRNNQSDVLANGLIGAIAKDSLGGDVPAGN